MKEIRFSNGTLQIVNKIIGVGKNYAAHAAEMNSSPPGEPIIFFKPATSLVDIEKPIKIPKSFGSVHYELELAICVSKEASQVPKEKTMEYVAGYGMAIDLTLRDVQKTAKNQGHPWALAKGFDGSCPVSVFKPVTEVQDISDLTIRLELNGEERQNASTSQMLFPVDEIIRYVTQYVTLLPGDIILTGTPAGVGPLSPGDKINASITNIASVHTTII